MLMTITAGNGEFGVSEDGEEIIPIGTANEIAKDALTYLASLIPEEFRTPVVINLLIFLMAKNIKWVRD